MLLLGDSDAPAAAAAATTAALSKAVDEVDPPPPPLLRINFVKYHPNTIVVKQYL